MSVDYYQRIVNGLDKEYAENCFKKYNEKVWQQKRCCRKFALWL